MSVSSKGQIVIPERVRKSFGIRPGSKLVLFEQENSLLIKREEEVEKTMGNDERKEKVGWMLLGEKALKDLWDNPKDEKVWKRYL